MKSLNENWDNCRSQIFEAVVAEEAGTEDQLCCLCLQNPCKIRCYSCHGRRFCTACDLIAHEHNAFHDRDVFVSGFFQAVPPTTSVNDNGNLVTINKSPSFCKPTCCPFCADGNLVECFNSNSILIIVNEKGRFDFKKPSFRCENCGKDAPSLSLTTIIHSGYWPGSPNDPNYLFHQDLFILWDSLQKRMPGTSESSFIKGLEDFSFSKARAPSINSTTFTRSFREWKFCQHELTLLQKMDWMKCPPCSINQHSCHVDGNMKLYRYNRSGSQRTPSYYEDLFIANKIEVDEHIKNIYSKQPKEKDKDDDTCGESHWKAASNRMKKRKNLDETGLEIAGCRHGIAQWAVNMYRGEIYGYPHFIQEKRMQQANVNYFWEDVVCKYWKWAKRGGILVGNMKPALSVMHAKAHSWSCQIIWGGRWQNGSAWTTGEEVEQINSYMSRCGNTTKYMLPECRDELLTEHALTWNRRKIFKMVDSLYQRYVRAVKMKLESTNSLYKALQEVNLDVQKPQIDTWKNEVIQNAKESQMIQNYSERKELASLEKQIEMAHFSIVQTTMSIGKLAATSKQRTRLRKNVLNHKSKLKSLVDKYNTLVDEKKIGSQVALDDVEKGNFIWDASLNAKLERSKLDGKGTQVQVNKIALLNKGLHFCKEQAKKALDKFSTIKDIELDKLPDDWYPMDDDDLLEEDDDEASSDAEDDTFDTSKPVLLPNDKLSVCLQSNHSTDTVWVWVFPDDISQSTLDGRNGSNACTVIAIVLADLLNSSHIHLQPSDILPLEWSNMMISSIRQGNNLYDLSRSSLPHRYLSVAEAAVVVSDSIDVNVSQPLPVRIVDTHERSTLKSNISQLCLSSGDNENSYAILVIHNMSVLFVGMRRKFVILIDTHSHNPSGAAIVLGKLDNIDEFIAMCKEIVNIRDDTAYGNFVILKF